MNNLEIHIGIEQQYNRDVFITIVYALIKCDCSWLWVCERRHKEQTFYLSRVMNDKVSVRDGYLFLTGTDLMDILQQGYVLGTIIKRRVRSRHYEQLTVG